MNHQSNRSLNIIGFGEPNSPYSDSSIFSRSIGLLSFILVITMIILTIYISSISNAIFDTDHMFDFLFILGAAWRINQGFTPVLDFGYFYGGPLEKIIAVFMEISGRDISVFHHTTLLLLLIFFILIMIIFYSRLSLLRMSLLFLIITTLLLTRQPLEFPVTGSGLIATHSFLYNRVGLAVLVVCGMFVSLPSFNRGSEFTGSVLLGCLVAFSSFVKPTFAILLFVTPFILLIQSRLLALFAFVISILTIIAIYDPRLEIFRGAIAYTSSHLAGEPAAQFDYLLLRAIRVPLAEVLATLLALVALCYVLRSSASRQALIGTAIMALAGIGMTVTMGGAPGQLALPIAAFVGLAAAEWAERNRMAFRSPLQWLSVAIVLSLSLPHTANLLGVAGVSHRYEDLLLIKTGPYSRYVALDRTRLGSKHRPSYEMFADGIKLLSSINDVSQFGIVADQGMTFEYALMSRPVPDYPLWQRKTAPEFDLETPLPEVVDIVMIGRKDVAISLREILLKKMENKFSRCLISEYWELFVRIELKSAICK